MSKVKICGLCRLEDIDAVNQALPDFIGFVFAESRRRIEIKKAQMLKRRLDERIKAVGVFVNERIEIISNLYRKGIIDLVQLHGDEDLSYIRQLRECPVIKVVRIADVLPPLPEETEYLIFDNKNGGSGKPFDWDLLKNLKGHKYFLAGGLSKKNVADAIQFLNPFCVDVSSGVETDGLKDAEKILEFVRIVRENNK